MVDPETAETWRTVGALARLLRLQKDPELLEELVREERRREARMRGRLWAAQMLGLLDKEKER